MGRPRIRGAARDGILTGRFSAWVWILREGQVGEGDQGEYWTRRLMSDSNESGARAVADQGRARADLDKQAAAYQAMDVMRVDAKRLSAAALRQFEAWQALVPHARELGLGAEEVCRSIEVSRALGSRLPLGRYGLRTTASLTQAVGTCRDMQALVDKAAAAAGKGADLLARVPEVMGRVAEYTHPHATYDVEPRLRRELAELSQLLEALKTGSRELRKAAASLEVEVQKAAEWLEQVRRDVGAFLDFRGYLPGQDRVGQLRDIEELRQALQELRVPVVLEAFERAPGGDTRVSATVPDYRELEEGRRLRSELLGSRLEASTKTQGHYRAGLAEIAVAVLALSSTESADDSVVVNLWVDGVDPSTGRDARSCLVSVRASCSEIRDLDLQRLDPNACVRALRGAIAPGARAVSPIRPLVNFDKSDSRFVASVDVVHGLESAPNLMELTPGDFESLIENLFSAMGLDTRLTRASRDGGVDCVAWDQRPVLGGKIIIQAKRYKNPVGVSAVRDLFGAVHNEGASKGILVTTSGFGRGSFDFAKDKPLELLDGANLLHLLDEYLQLRARIEVPEDWTDAVPDGDYAAPLYRS